MASKIETLKANLEAALGERVVSLTEAVGELTLVVRARDYVEVATLLRDDRKLGFELEGTLRKGYESPQEGFVDDFIMGLIPD